jgi:hypothetical protein
MWKAAPLTQASSGAWNGYNLLGGTDDIVGGRQQCHPREETIFDRQLGGQELSPHALKRH